MAISDLAPILAAPEVAHWIGLEQAAALAQKAADAAHESIPRHNVDTLMLAFEEAKQETEKPKPKARR